MRAEQSECIEEKLCDTRTDGGLPIVAVYSDAGTKLVSYAYDAWGNHTISYHNGGENTPAQYNPFRYRSYYYDTDLGLYYLNSRYYDAAVGRFISADDIGVIIATPMGLTDKNLYAYCDNNPVMRVDGGGAFWDTLFDVVSLVVSVIDVVQNPSDPMAWVGLAADVVSLAVPGLTGGGAVVDAITKADDVIDAVKTIDNVGDAARALDNAGDVAQITKGTSIIKNDVLDLPRVGSALQTDLYHAFPDIIDNYAGYATKNNISNGVLYQLEGSFNGKMGRFEWIIQNQQITHRMFVEGGGINGIPIRR